MKKFMFTAIALVAFSGVSMAKAIKDGEVVKRDNKKELKVMKTLNDPCLSAYQDTLNATIGDYGSQLAGQMATAAWNVCRDVRCPNDNCH